jgi:hypothetical protein
VLGERRRDLALDCLQRIVRVSAGQAPKDALDTIEQSTRVLERPHRIPERGFGFVLGDALDLGAMPSQCVLEGGSEMSWLDLLEVRKAERRGGLSEQGIGGSGCHFDLVSDLGSGKCT